MSTNGAIQGLIDVIKRGDVRLIIAMNAAILTLIGIVFTSFYTAINPFYVALSWKGISVSMWGLISVVAGTGMAFTYVVENSATTRQMLWINRVALGGFAALAFSIYLRMAMAFGFESFYAESITYIVLSLSSIWLLYRSYSKRPLRSSFVSVERVSDVRIRHSE